MSDCLYMRVVGRRGHVMYKGPELSEVGAAVIGTVQKVLAGSKSGDHAAVRGKGRSVERSGD